MYLCSVNFLDIIILIPLAYAAWVGFKKGFIIEVFTLMALFLGLYAGIHFSEFASNGIQKLTGWNSSYLPAVSFTLTFLAVGAMVYFAGKALEKIVKLTLLSPLNKIGGVIFALLKGSYIVSVVLLLLSSYDKNNKFIPLESKNNSLLYHPMVKLSSSTIPGFRNSSFFQEQDSSQVNLTVDQVIRAKEIADSLGIDAQDVVELNEIYQEYEMQN
ncbi:MAG: Colicin production protein [Crocinitomicaceae bacterium]|nr:Colicin production protein [Crocinitomicaceae bacterium]